MMEWLAFFLPPATAFAGMRLTHWLGGQRFEEKFGIGLRFAIGLAIGMLVFSQAALFGALAGVNLTGGLAWLALVWGAVEVVLLLPKAAAGLKGIKFQPAYLRLLLPYLWLLLLLPVIWSWWVFGRLSTLEGTLEFDANVFWVFKSKVLYLAQGQNLLHWMHDTELAYAHWDYPLLVTCLYTLDYGLMGRVDEFVNKVWPFWMFVGLCLGLLSIGKVWKQPRPLPIVTVLAFGFLPATLHFIRQEGGAMPMTFYVCLTALLVVNALCHADEFSLAIAIPVVAGCAMTKFEGVVYAAVWFCVLLPFCWRHRWLKKGVLWKFLSASVVCLLPFVWYRLSKPVPYPLSDWWRTAIALPEPVLACFPRAWFLNFFSRFFDSGFFHWLPGEGVDMKWIGKWDGLGSIVNAQLGLLPWLLVFLLAFSLWKKRSRLALTCVSAVILGEFTILSFVISCLAYKQPGVPELFNMRYVVDYSADLEMGRYYFPFFAAWFLTMLALWFNDPMPPPAETPAASRDKPPPERAIPSKRRR